MVSNVIDFALLGNRVARLLRRIRKTCEVVVVASPKPIVFQRHLVSIHA